MDSQKKQSCVVQLEKLFHPDIAELVGSKLIVEFDSAESPS